MMVEATKNSVVRLSDLCTRVLLYLAAFRRSAGRVPMEPALVRDNLVALFQGLDQEARQDPRVFDLYRKAKYLLTVTADDLALALDWEGAPRWQVLESEFFNSKIGGTKFFEHLQDAEWRHPELLEVFYLCLSVGFHGKFMIRGQDELDKLRNELFLNLRDVPREAADKFTPEAYETHERDFTRLPGVNALRIAIILAGVFVVVAVGSAIAYGEQVRDLIDTADSIAKTDGVEPTGN